MDPTRTQRSPIDAGYLRAYATNLHTRIRSMEYGMARLDREHATLAANGAGHGEVLHNRIRYVELKRAHDQMSYTWQVADRAATAAEAAAPAEEMKEARAA